MVLTLCLPRAAQASPRAQLSPTQVRRLSRIWKTSVVPGQMTKGQFLAQTKVPQRIYYSLIADKKNFPEPRVKAHGGGPARRSFSGEELALMKSDWQRVADRADKEFTRTAFMQKHRTDSKMLKRLRQEHPEIFFSLVGRTRRKDFAPAKVERMKSDWLTVIAGRMHEVDFRQKHGLSTGLFARLRDEQAYAADFPKLMGTGADRTVVQMAPKVVDDWARVRQGKMSAATFRKRHPDARAVELLRLQRQALRAGGRTLGERLGFDRPTLTDKHIALLDRHWARVTRREISQRALLKQLRIPDARFYQYRREHQGAYPAATPKPKTPPKPRRQSMFARPDLYALTTLDPAKQHFAAYHRGQINFSQVRQRLDKLGISSSSAGIAYLRKIDPVAFSTRGDFVDQHYDAIIGHLLRIAREHKHVIRKWSDLQEVARQDNRLQAEFGNINLAPMSKTMRRDRDGDRRLHNYLAQFSQIGKASGPPRGSTRSKGHSAQGPRAPAGSGAPSRRESARALARALKGKKPTPENFDRAVVQLKASGDPNFSTRRKATQLRAEYDGVIRALAGWNFDSHRAYSLRYVARWAEATHEAGAGASYEQIAAIFRRSPEYKLDHRLPPKAHGSAQLARSYPELVSSWSTRRTYQRTRGVLELLRTAPEGATIPSLAGPLRQIGFNSTAQTYHALSRLTPAKVAKMGLDVELFSTLKKNGFHGLGKRRNPRFDANLEPPGIDLQLAREILETPQLPPMLKFGIRRLDGRRPFESHNVMFVNHRYSDIVSLVDAMADSGMSRSDAVFVSTPYPFKDSVSYQLRHRGLTVLEPKLSMSSYAKEVEHGIRLMLNKYGEEEKKWGKGKAILIMDDGGMASKIIGAKFKDHIGKFRIVEVTAAGHRLAGEFQQQHGRLAFPYYSIAYTPLKRRVTSAFYGGRVSDRLLNLIPQTEKPLANQRAAVLGAGPMGLFAGIGLAKQGYDVTFVDPDRRAARRIQLLAARRPDLKMRVDRLERALPGRSIILGMSGYQLLTPRHLRLIDDGAFIAQGSSKRKEFDMSGFEKEATKKVFLPRKDGLAQQSYSYTFGRGAKSKTLHFLGDGWTLNHDGSLHGTPMRDVQLELGILFESAVQAASTPLGQTGVFRTIGADVQNQYHRYWRKLYDRNR